MKPINDRLVNEILSDPNAKDNIILRVERDETTEPTLKCYIYHEMDDNSVAYLSVNEEILSGISATKDELLDLAYNNTFRFHSPISAAFMDSVRESFDTYDLYSNEFDYKLFKHDLFPGIAITSGKRMNGAVCIFIPKVMKRIHDMLGDFYISFTSRHECIIHPCAIIPDDLISGLIDAIQFTNETATLEEDVLTYSLYKCTDITGELQIVKYASKEKENE